MKSLLGIFLFATVGWAQFSQTLAEHIMNDPVGIINGERAYPGQFPYLAGIKLSGLEWINCIGVLVDQNWVVCHRTCASLSSKVYLGIYDWDDPENGGRTEIYDVVESIRHPDGNHSIGMMRLAVPVMPGNPFIQQAPLAVDDGDYYFDADCFIAGWYASLGTFEKPLMYGRTKTITDEECNARIFPGFTIPEDICVYNGLTAACNGQGDSGSVLVCKRDAIPRVVGFFLTGPACDPARPTVFTLISVNRDWMKSITG